MRSPVSWGLLGLVIQRPSYGYELVQRFERVYADALELSSASQIYTAIDALVRRSLIEELPADSLPSDPGRQPKPHYAATAVGAETYRGWLIAQADDERRRSRLFALQLAMLRPAEALGVIEGFERACLASASRHSPAIAGDPGTDGLGGLADRLVQEQERLALDARLAWIEYARREFGTAGARRGAPK
jgi:DNA-binding PadR family transcriptional regulator